MWTNSFWWQTILYSQDHCQGTYSLDKLVLGLAFKSLIHLGWFLCIILKVCCTEYPVFSTPFIEETILPHLVFLVSLSKINWPHKHGFISSFSNLFLWSMCLSCCFQQVYEKVPNITYQQGNANQITVGYPLTPVRTAIIKMLKANKCWQECEEKIILVHCW